MDTFQIAESNITLFQGDCLEKMGNIADGSVDTIICDLPFGTTACKWDVILPFEPLWAHYWRISKPGAAIILTGCQPFTSLLITSQIKYFKYELIWHKSKSGSAFTAKYRSRERFIKKAEDKIKR